MIINLISSPRNVSTAFMYSFAQRSDTKVLDEPFYGIYLKKSNVDHPGKLEILNNLSLDTQKVIQYIHDLQEEHEHVFVKNMAHHLFDLDSSFMHEYLNLFFIRNPEQIITSFSKVIHDPTLQDIGIKQQLALYHDLRNKCSRAPIVVDSASLITNPRVLLSELCSQLGIPFSESMLQWKLGGIKEDGIWAKYWYSNVHNSTGFQLPKNDKTQLPKHLSSLRDEAFPYYIELKKHALTI